MIRIQLPHRQHGAALAVGLIMLTLITLMVVTAFTLSGSNLKAVGNMQFKNEATAAANKAIEQIISSNFTVATSPETVNVDLNNDGNNDYTVTVAVPSCIRATKAGEPILSSISLGAGMSAASNWNTVWNIEATVLDVKTGASVRIHSGVRALRSQIQKEAECP